jgi:hypothetical protein
MSLESGFITPQEMSNHLWLIARTQNGAEGRHLANGLLVPPYAVADHIEFDGGATFYPGTLDTGTNQGDGTCGILPPADDHYWFVHVAYCLWRAQGSAAFLSERVNGLTLLERLAAAFNAPTTDPLTGLFETTVTNRAVGFGFCDIVYFTGKVLFPSVLRYQAAGELAALCQAAQQPEAAAPYLEIQRRISANLAPTFTGPARLGGWLMAATEIGRQPDVWGTLYALHAGALSGKAAADATAAILAGVTNRTIVCEGGVRHVPTNADYSRNTAWERANASLDTYQNGAYWHTATGWLIEAVHRADPRLASDLRAEYIGHLRANDYRQKQLPAAPWECFYPPNHYTQNGAYLTSVTQPYAALVNMVHLDALAPGEKRTRFGR